MTAAEAADKVRKLRAVARSAAGTPEAETARTLADRPQGWGQDTGRTAGRTQGRAQGRPTVDGVRSTVGAYARRMV